ncbi:hypothetical protein GLAREA_10511 [Glarea lozoyensis ATCC 20868]|uniref:Secreted protein n=1 Tax=Glarea lozoyensis (strain ATCC 20868 / MF5171) TaxID=1116229 RepID=S3DS93_GLAL2|nr:uncharacterized protein GLAREA_10511 [Glarea lozoyensis ATCC 20868]EPE34816.1 hypothetical protein GLAREA_10511 [Glarea lozoyensis ATCC 20868]
MLLFNVIFAVVGFLTVCGAMPTIGYEDQDLPYPLVEDESSDGLSPDIEAAPFETDSESKGAEKAERDFTRRNKVKPPLCLKDIDNPDWQDTMRVCAEKAAYELSQNKTIKVPARKCVQGACFDEARIYICNDNEYDIEPAGEYLATYANDMVDECTHKKFPLWFPSITAGQAFDTDNYNVVVRKADPLECPRPGNTCKQDSYPGHPKT